MLRIVNTLSVAVFVMTGDPTDPANVHRLAPGDEFSVTQLPVSVVDEASADMQERRSSQSVTGRRVADPRDAGRHPFGNRGGAFARERDLSAARDADLDGSNAAAPRGNAVGGTGGHNDGSSVLKNSSGEQVQGQQGESVKARDTGAPAGKSK